MSRGTALITGASAGIGEAFARHFAKEGFDLVLTARRGELLASLAKELSREVHVDTVTGDLSTDDGISALCRNIDALSRPIDVLVNNAGMMVQQDFSALTNDQIHQTIALNITAVTRLTHHFLAGMTQRQSGRILNVASVAAFHPVPGMDLYAATKAYVLSLTESLAENLRGSGVYATVLCPGLTATEMVDESIASVMPPFAISTPEDVAREGYQALMNREVVCIPGNANKAALAWAQHQPRWLVRGLGGLAARFTSAR